mmetsp:Transcript_11892/g.34224  ORF Transcript_11892/g.34224 Transcript_11892/m.34224 type:complete len:251 (+) Transcript_11892:208-960(+)
MVECRVTETLHPAGRVGTCLDLGRIATCAAQSPYRQRAAAQPTDRWDGCAVRAYGRAPARRHAVAAEALHPPCALQLLARGRRVEDSGHRLLRRVAHRLVERVAVERVRSAAVACEAPAQVAGRGEGHQAARCSAGRRGHQGKSPTLVACATAHWPSIPICFPECSSCLPAHPEPPLCLSNPAWHISLQTRPHRHVSSLHHSRPAEPLLCDRSSSSALATAPGGRGISARRSPAYCCARLARWRPSDPSC